MILADRVVCDDVVIGRSSALAALLRGAAAVDGDPPAQPMKVLGVIAGVLQTSPTRRITTDGYEETLAVNALAPSLLTRLLLPIVRRSAPARIVTVSTRLHLPRSRGAPVDFDFGDPQLEHGYNAARAYKNSSSRSSGSRMSCSVGCPRVLP